MRLDKLLSGAGIECPREISSLEIKSVVTDSRKATDGCMFIALKGNNTDGHEHVEQAVKNGAVVIVVEQVREWCVGGAAIILVESTKRASALLYNTQYGIFERELKLIGVTGTNGKTSVCAALESIFLNASIPCAVVGTTGCRINGVQSRLCRSGLTTPDAAELCPFLAFAAESGIKYVFMEVSSHALSQYRVEGLKFEYGIFTNLTRDHLDYHGTMESYFQSKARLFEVCRQRVINISDPYGKRLGGMYGGIFASARENAQACARNIECTKNGISYTLVYGGQEIEIESPALGDFSIINTLLAATVALCEGIDATAVKRGLSLFFGAEGRMERVSPKNSPFEVIIDFAHTPDALERVLVNAHATKREQGRIILVFGCGGDRDRGKRRQMANIASRLCDLTVITTDNSRSENAKDIIRDILSGIDKEKPYRCIEDRRRAIEFALDNARLGDTVLICGKGHEKYQIDGTGKHPFDEKKIVTEYLRNKITLLDT